ncbi:cold shock domain protein CspD [Proteobacteria bacterium 005FR1]|nr:cold shock domain protein CspD [Proteobacteria bacterium 005FR1]
MPTGTVKWFNNAKGYGFILPDQGGEDLFVHYTSILMDGYKTLKAGQAVSFEVVKGGKGLHATNIRSPDSSAATEQGSASASRDAEEDQTSDSGSSRLETYS